MPRGAVSNLGMHLMKSRGRVLLLLPAALLGLAGLLGACAASDAQPSCGGRPCCQALGGHCGSPDVLCGSGQGWGGYELCGEQDNDSCCLPIVAPAAASRCQQVGGACAAPGAPCPAGAVSAGVQNDLCPRQGSLRPPCCLPAP